MKNNSSVKNEIIQWKKRLKLKNKNIYERNVDDLPKGDTTYKSNNNHNISNAKIKISNLLKVQRPNCYYNSLHLIKLSKISKKNSYQNLD